MTAFTILGSGSTGNAILVKGDGALLLDAGFSARTLETQLAAAGVRPSALDAIVLTHEHGDHARGAPLLAQRHGVPILSTTGTLAALPPGDYATRALAYGERTRVGPLHVELFPVPHDAAMPCGVRIEDGNSRMGYLTDAGAVTPEIERALGGCQNLLIEANHDPDLLRHGPYPYPLKARISGGRGHLSNDACGALLARLARTDVRRAVLHHLSRNNNTPELALATTHSFLHRQGLAVADLAAAPPHGPFGPFAWD